jgi:hypothetical protein
LLAEFTLSVRKAVAYDRGRGDVSMGDTIAAGVAEWVGSR